MAKHKHRETAIPRNVTEAEQRGHAKTEGFNLSSFTASHAAKAGTHLSPSNAKPGDVAWVGPCEEGGTRIVCYYDQNMDPSDCRNQPC